MQQPQSDPTDSPTGASETPQPTPPPPPPPLPLLLPAAPLSQPATPPSPDTISPFLGTLESLQRAAQTQSKWAIILLLPPNTPYAQPSLPAPQAFQKGVLLWRRPTTSPEATRYKSFYPVDEHPHVALLDPRTGERLLVWPKGSGSRESRDETPMEPDTGSNGNMVDGKIAPRVWQHVVDDVLNFLPEHSLDGDDVGPVHIHEKPWHVRTRRVSADDDDTTPKPSALMDDEEAAIAAAIAASLQDAEAAHASSSTPEGSPSETEEEEDDAAREEDDDDMGKGNSPSDSYDAASDTSRFSRTASIATTNDDIVSTASSTFAGCASSMSLPTTPRKTGGLAMTPALDIARPLETASSVDSLSSSYLERMASCLRSSTDPRLLEARRLRLEQDAQLAASLQSDRAREAAEHELHKEHLDKLCMVDDARQRLPDEPMAGGKDVVAIALRLSDGQRLSRKFDGSNGMQAIADFVIVATGGDVIPPSRVDAFLRAPGVDLARVGWGTPLCDAGFGKRAAFFVQA